MAKINLQKQRTMMALENSNSGTTTLRVNSVLKEAEISQANSGPQPSQAFREVAILGPGKSFGELGLIMQKPRAATVRCLGDVHLATLDK